MVLVCERSVYFGAVVSACESGGCTKMIVLSIIAQPISVTRITEGNEVRLVSIICRGAAAAAGSG